MREWVLIRSTLLLLLRICHPGLRKAVPPEPGVRKAVPPEPGVRKAAPPAFCFLPLTWGATDASKRGTKQARLTQMNCMQVPFWFSCNCLDHTLLRSTLTRLLISTFVMMHEYACTFIHTYMQNIVDSNTEHAQHVIDAHATS